MNWRIDFSASSLKFLKQNNLDENFVIEKLRLTFQKFQGEDINISIKKLGGKWDGFYRIRSGRLRIIAEFQFERNRAYVEEIDWRGNAYK
ncbi:MAG: type II toxin-antitoxin system RelE/ParE family toxin [Patescibacteria group bacterium]